MPCVSSYVGADIVADILATELHRLPGVRLLIDIGTNGEIVLARDGEIITCATAAGPAFEGAHIECGMRAAPGAIDHVSRDGMLRATLIGDGQEPRGLCGSGLLDAAAAMVEAGIVDPSGRFQPREQVPASLGERLMAAGGLPAFQLTPGSRQPVYVSQSDIRQLQMAKGATRAGIEILLRDFHLDYQQIDEVLLAGAFGSFIDPASALAIGLCRRCRSSVCVPSATRRAPGPVWPPSQRRPAPRRLRSPKSPVMSSCLPGRISTACFCR